MILVFKYFYRMIPKKKSIATNSILVIKLIVQILVSALKPFYSTLYSYCLIFFYKQDLLVDYSPFAFLDRAAYASAANCHKMIAPARGLHQQTIMIYQFTPLYRLLYSYFTTITEIACGCTDII